MGLHVWFRGFSPEKSKKNRSVQVIQKPGDIGGRAGSFLLRDRRLRPLALRLPLKGFPQFRFRQQAVSGGAGIPADLFQAGKVDGYSRSCRPCLFPASRRTAPPPRKGQPRPLQDFPGGSDRSLSASGTAGPLRAEAPAAVSGRNTEGHTVPPARSRRGSDRLCRRSARNLYPHGCVLPVNRVGQGMPGKGFLLSKAGSEK